MDEINILENIRHINNLSEINMSSQYLKVATTNLFQEKYLDILGNMDVAFKFKETLNRVLSKSKKLKPLYGIYKGEKQIVGFESNGNTIVRVCLVGYFDDIKGVNEYLMDTSSSAEDQVLKYGLLCDNKIFVDDFIFEFFSNIGCTNLGFVSYGHQPYVAHDFSLDKEILKAVLPVDDHHGCVTILKKDECSARDYKYQYETNKINDKDVVYVKSVFLNNRRNLTDEEYRYLYGGKRTIGSIIKRTRNLINKKLRGE